MWAGSRLRFIRNYRMNYQEFKQKYLGKFIDYDKAFWYQCVDLIKAVLDWCYQVGPVGVMGNAIDYMESLPRMYPQFKQYLTNNKQLTPWDIVISPYLWIMINSKMSGHMWLFDSYWPNLTINVLEQNGRWWTWGKGWAGNEIRIKNYPMIKFPYFITDKPLRPINEPMPKYEEKVGFSLDERVRNHVGKVVDWNNDWKGLCAELVDKYAMDRRGIPYPPSNSSYYYIGPFCSKYGFERSKIRVDSLDTLKPGDILQADPSASWGAGHIGICIEVIRNFWWIVVLHGIRSFEQNAWGDGTAILVLSSWDRWDYVIQKR